MDLSPSLLGLAIGLIIGLLDFIILTFMAKQLVKKAQADGLSREESGGSIRLIKAAALLSLILFPLIGYIAGPYVFGNLSGNVGG